MSSENWKRIRDHEGGHAVIGWLYASRPHVIGGANVGKKNGRLVADVTLNTALPNITSDSLCRVGVAGLLSEAKGAVERAHHQATFRSSIGLASAIMGCIQQHIAGLTPPEEAWAINVDVAPAERLTPAVITLSDVIDAAAHPHLTVGRIARFIDNVCDRLDQDRVWEAVKAVGQAIPPKVGAAVSAVTIRRILQERLPRKW